MLQATTIEKLLMSLNDALKKRGVLGEICLCGGAVMCLVFKARRSTRDVDAIFEPTSAIREAAHEVARQHHIPADWLNDAAKGWFLSSPPVINVLQASNLRVYAPTADYMLAMKCVSARFDSHDAEDVKFLIRHLELKAADEVFRIIEQYYPQKKIPPKTQFLVDEIMASRTCSPKRAAT